MSVAASRSTARSRAAPRRPRYQTRTSPVVLPDPRLQERACAVVVLKSGVPGLTMDDMRAFLAEKGVARQYWPERLELLPELPRTPSGKIRKFELRDMLR